MEKQTGTLLTPDDYRATDITIHTYRQDNTNKYYITSNNDVVLFDNIPISQRRMIITQNNEAYNIIEATNAPNIILVNTHNSTNNVEDPIPTINTNDVNWNEYITTFT